MRQTEKDARRFHDYTYYVQGMHCPGCELRIEKKLRGLAGVVYASASNRASSVKIRCHGPRPPQGALNRLFQEDGYTFSDHETAAGAASLPVTLGVAIALIAGFLLLQQTGLSSLLHVDATSALPTFFLFGLLAGGSSCAALLSGIILSLSRVRTGADESFGTRARPSLAFVAGRIIGFGLLGGLLGAIGQGLQFSRSLSSGLVVLVSLVMVVLALQMLGIGGGASWIALPKSITGRIADGSVSRGRAAPVIIGALTFFLPCGFTITAQGVALVSGDPVTGGLIMLLFALGTAPGLLGIGLFSAAFLSHSRLATQFSRIAGVLVLFFALYNLNAQLTVVGLPSLADLSIQPAVSASTANRGPAIPERIGGKQVIRMQASAFGYSPRWFRVQAGTPVRWEITDVGTSGCTNAVISGRLFEGEIPLQPGAVSVKEFTPTRTGKFKFSCWMGMVWGVIEVVDGEAPGQSG